MNLSHFKYLFAVIGGTISVSLFCSLRAHSQVSTVDNIPKNMNVGVYVSPPFVIENDGEFSGLSVELWEHIAKDLNINFNYKVYDNFHDLVEATSVDSVNVAVTNLTITKDRAHKIDFTQPWYDAGLRIMINQRKASNSNDIINGLRDAGHLTSYFILAIIVIVLTLLMTLFDRKYDKEFPKNWMDGISESFYQVMLMFTTGNLKRKNLFGWIGRILSALWLAVGILIVAYVTSSITSVMTTLSLSNEINQLSDLNGKKIGVLKGSETEEFIHGRGFHTQSFKNLEEMVKGIENNSVDALVGDAPVLQYYQFTHQDKTVTVVGNLFKPDKYGFGLSPNSPLKKEITLEILKAQESGFIRKLKSKYFGVIQ